MTPRAMIPNQVSNRIQNGFWNGVALSYGFGSGSPGSLIDGFTSSLLDAAQYAGEIG